MRDPARQLDDQDIRSAQSTRCSAADEKVGHPGVESLQDITAIKQMGILDAMNSAAVLLSASGQVVCCNHAFGRLPEDGIMIRDQKLIATDAGSSARLTRMVRRAFAVAARSSAEEMRTVILVRQNHRPLLATVLIVHAQFDRPQNNCAILLITDPDDRSRPDEAILRGAFGMTAAEARLAQSVAAGECLGDVAVRSGVSRRTVTRQLRAIFKKTKLHRRSELVRLLMGLRSPLFRK